MNENKPNNDGNSWYETHPPIAWLSHAITSKRLYMAVLAAIVVTASLIVILLTLTTYLQTVTNTGILAIIFLVILCCVLIGQSLTESLSTSNNLKNEKLLLENTIHKQEEQINQLEEDKLQLYKLIKGNTSGDATYSDRFHSKLLEAIDNFFVFFIAHIRQAHFFKENINLINDEIYTSQILLEENQLKAVISKGGIHGIIYALTFSVHKPLNNSEKHSIQIGTAVIQRVYEDYSIAILEPFSTEKYWEKIKSECENGNGVSLEQLPIKPIIRDELQSYSLETLSEMIGVMQGTIHGEIRELVKTILIEDEKTNG